MYYDAATGGSTGDTGHNCLAMATATTLNPVAPTFTDTSAGPFYCQPQLGGSIDPQPVVDPTTGHAYLLWKSNDGGSSQPGRIWSAQLNGSGTGFVTSPVELLYNDTVDFPWETTVENPAMAFVNGTWYLLFSGGKWNSTGYAEGYAVCDGPSGPCSQPQVGPILSSYGQVSGPGGGSLYQDSSGQWWLDYAAWTAGCASYSCGGARDLYVAPINFVGDPPSGYWETASDGGIFAFAAPFAGSMGATPLNRPVVGIAGAPGGSGYWEVASDGGIFAFDAPFEGSMGGSHLNQPIVGIAAPKDAQGYWEVASDGGIFAFEAPYEGSMGGSHLNQPIVGMASGFDNQGYWMVASDGGIFSFGDAAFYGSMGGTHLNQPIVGMASTADGRGYWMVAADGGIFSFGDAAFYGSMGGTHLNQPIVGMASTADGRGYWMVASDGGIFSFGDAAFYGSMGGTHLNQPIVGMAG